MTIEQALRALRRAVRRLSPEQGRVARRNARQKVKGALRALRHAMDEEFPTILIPREPRKSRYKPLSEIPESKRAEAKAARQRASLKRRGFVCSSIAIGIACAEAGVKVVRVEEGNSSEIWAPAWADKIGPDAKRLKDARIHPHDRALITGKIALERADLGGAS